MGTDGATQAMDEWHLFFCKVKSLVSLLHTHKRVTKESQESRAFDESSQEVLSVLNIIVLNVLPLSLSQD